MASDSYINMDMIAAVFLPGPDKLNAASGHEICESLLRFHQDLSVTVDEVMQVLKMLDACERNEKVSATKRLFAFLCAISVMQHPMFRPDRQYTDKYALVSPVLYSRLRDHLSDAEMCDDNDAAALFTVIASWLGFAGANPLLPCVASIIMVSLHRPCVLADPVMGSLWGQAFGIFLGHHSRNPILLPLYAQTLLGRQWQCDAVFMSGLALLNGEYSAVDVRMAADKLYDFYHREKCVQKKYALAILGAHMTLHSTLADHAGCMGIMNDFKKSCEHNFPDPSNQNRNRVADAIVGSWASLKAALLRAEMTLTQANMLAEFIANNASSGEQPIAVMIDLCRLVPSMHNDDLDESTDDEGHAKDAVQQILERQQQDDRDRSGTSVAVLHSAMRFLLRVNNPRESSGHCFLPVDAVYDCLCELIPAVMSYHGELTKAAVLGLMDDFKKSKEAQLRVGRFTKSLEEILQCAAGKDPEKLKHFLLSLHDKCLKHPIAISVYWSTVYQFLEGGNTVQASISVRDCMQSLSQALLERTLSISPAILLADDRQMFEVFRAWKSLNLLILAYDLWPKCAPLIDEVDADLMVCLGSHLTAIFSNVHLSPAGRADLLRVAHAMDAVMDQANRLLSGFATELSQSSLSQPFGGELPKQCQKTCRAIRRAVAKEINFIPDFIGIMNERCHFEARIPRRGPSRMLFFPSRAVESLLQVQAQSFDSIDLKLVWNCIGQRYARLAQPKKSSVSASAAGSADVAPVDAMRGGNELPPAKRLRRRMGPA